MQALRKIKKDLKILDRSLFRANQKSILGIKEPQELREEVEREIKLLSETELGKSIINLEKVQAARKGKKTRNFMLTTKQMLSILQNKLIGVGLIELKNVSRGLCREINQTMDDAMINESKYRGKTIKLKPSFVNSTLTYPFYSHELKQTKQIYIHFSFWLQFSNDGKHLDLLIMPPNQDLLGSGAYKTVIRAQRFNISLNVKAVPSQTIPTLYDRESQYRPQVLLRSRDTYSTSKIENSLKLQKSLKSRNIPGIPSAPEKPVPLVETKSDYSEYSQEWYNSDLSNAVKVRKVPLDYSENPATLDLSTSHLLDVIIDVGNSLVAWHQADVVHCDVKPPNILLQVASDHQTVKGLITDFDISQETGKGLIESNDYFYWDAMMQKGVASHFTDVFGLAMTLAEVIIPDYQSCVNTETILTEDGRNEFIEKAKTLPHFKTAENVPSKLQLNVLKQTMNLIAEVIIINKTISSVFFHEIYTFKQVYHNEREQQEFYKAQAQAINSRMTMKTFVERVKAIRSHFCKCIKSKIKF